MTNYKYFDNINFEALTTTPASVSDTVASYRHSLSSETSYGFRFVSIQYQNGMPKACSDWVSYFSNYSEIWSFFLFFYALALLFFFFYIIPEALASNRLALNFATPKSWISGAIACGVPFVLIFNILYESIFLLFLNETYRGRILPTFLIEGRQWKWEYRYNLASLFEHIAGFKLLGHNKAAATGQVGPLLTKTVISKINMTLGSELTEASARVKSELLKSTRSGVSTHDLLSVTGRNLTPGNSLRPQFAFSVPEYFSRFRVSETTRRILTATRSIVLPGVSTVRAQITSADVIHSWTIPGLGVRIDAVPGKLYAVKIPFKYYGTFTGQCSEVCGLRHAYMPISISFVPHVMFVKSIYVLLLSGADLFFFKFHAKDSSL